MLLRMTLAHPRRSANLLQAINQTHKTNKPMEEDKKEPINLDDMIDVSELRHGHKAPSFRAHEDEMSAKIQRNDSGTVRIILRVPERYLQASDLFPGQRVRIRVTDNPQKALAVMLSENSVGWMMSAYNTSSMPAKEIYAKKLRVKSVLQFTVYSPIGVPDPDKNDVILIPHSHVSCGEGYIHINWTFLEADKLGTTDNQ